MMKVNLLTSASFLESTKFINLIHLKLASDFPIIQKEPILAKNMKTLK